MKFKSSGTVNYALLDLQKPSLKEIYSIPTHVSYNHVLSRNINQGQRQLPKSGGAQFPMQLDPSCRAHFHEGSI